MYSAKEYIAPSTVEECYAIYQEKKRSRLLAGNMFLRMSRANIPLLIDLSNAGLDYIDRDADGSIRIGAMTTLREAETSQVLRSAADGIISRSVGEILGIQFRALATVGASVASKYGFSDVITPLLAANASIRLYAGGLMPLSEYLSSERTRDILTEVILPNPKNRGVFLNYRNSKGDFSILNMALTRSEQGYRIAVGARPAVASLAENAMRLADAGALPQEVGKEASRELVFSSNMRASAEYRRHLCEINIARLYSELKGKRDV